MLATVSALLAVPALAQANAITWDNGGDQSSWADDANWSGDIAPTAADDVTVDGTANVHINSAAQAQSLHIMDSASVYVNTATTLEVPTTTIDDTATFIVNGVVDSPVGSVTITNNAPRSAPTSDFGGLHIISSSAATDTFVASGVTTVLIDGAGTGNTVLATALVLPDSVTDLTIASGTFQMEQGYIQGTNAAMTIGAPGTSAVLENLRENADTEVRIPTTLTGHSTIRHGGDSDTRAFDFTAGLILGDGSTIEFKDINNPGGGLPDGVVRLSGDGVFELEGDLNLVSTSADPVTHPNDKAIGTLDVTATSGLSIANGATLDLDAYGDTLDLHTSTSGNFSIVHGMVNSYDPMPFGSDSTITLDTAFSFHGDADLDGSTLTANNQLFVYGPATIGNGSIELGTDAQFNTENDAVAFDDDLTVTGTDTTTYQLNVDTTFASLGAFPSYDVATKTLTGAWILGQDVQATTPSDADGIEQLASGDVWHGGLTLNSGAAFVRDDAEQTNELTGRTVTVSNIVDDPDDVPNHPAGFRLEGECYTPALDPIACVYPAASLPSTIVSGANTELKLNGTATIADEVVIGTNVEATIGGDFTADTITNHGWLLLEGVLADEADTDALVVDDVRSTITLGAGGINIDRGSLELSYVKVDGDINVTGGSVSGLGFITGTMDVSGDTQAEANENFECGEEDDCDDPLYTEVALDGGSVTDLNVSGGDFLLGDDASDMAVLHVSDAATFSGGHLQVRVLDVAADEFDQIVAGGTASLSDDTEVSIDWQDSGIAPEDLGQLDAAFFTGDFSADAPFTGTVTSEEYDNNFGDVDLALRVISSDTARTLRTVESIAPTAPTSSTHAGHTAGVATNDTTIDVTVSGATDNVDVAGYSITVDHADSTTPDASSDSSNASFTRTFGSDGTWWIHVRAVDAAGNASAGTLHIGPFVIDTTAPGAPSLSGAPSGSTTATSASLSFSSELGASFICSVDGGAFVACTSPKALAGLAVGAHSLAVAAMDAAGNVGSAASATWTVSAPVVETSKPIIEPPAKPPVKPAPKAIKPVGGAKALDVDKIAKAGLKVSLPVKAADVDGKVVLRVGAAGAKALGLKLPKHKKVLVLGTGTATSSKAGKITVKVILTKAAKRALARTKAAKIKAQLVVTLSDDGVSAKPVTTSIILTA
jgi:hypothetical protein